MRERLIRFACRLYLTQMTTWAFGKITVGFGVAGALLCGRVSFVAVPDKYTSDAVLRFTTPLPSYSRPATDEEFVTNLIQDALTRKSLADIIEKQGLYQRDRAREPIEADVVPHPLQADGSDRHVPEGLAAAKHRSEGRTPGFSYGLEVLDPANLPKLPSSPNRFLIAAMGLAGGLLLGVLTALVARTRASTAPAGNSPKSS